MEKNMEATIVYRGHIGKKKIQATIAYSGYIGMMEKKSETTIIQSLIEYCSIVYYVIF